MKLELRKVESKKANIITMIFSIYSNQHWCNKKLTNQKYCKGQRCSGRNNQGRRCCTPEKPCEEGEGDCDGPGDGGLNDGHTGCKGDLECGSNNCKQFGSFYHVKDDCCQKPSFVTTEKPPPVVFPGTPLEPPTGYMNEKRLLLILIWFRSKMYWP